MSWRDKLRILYAYVVREYKVWRFYRTTVIIDYLGMLGQLALFYIIAQMIKSSGVQLPFLKPYNNDYFAYVIIGLMLSRFITMAITQPQLAVGGLWYTRMEFYMLSPMPLSAYFTGMLIWGIIWNIQHIALFTVTGHLLGLRFAAGAAPYTATLIVGLTLLSTFGLGFIGASTFWFLKARGWINPVRFIVVDVLFTLATGMLFPVSVLPKWLQVAALFVPLTYAYDGVRRCLFGIPANEQQLLIHSWITINPIVMDIICILILTLVYVPLGIRLFNLGMKKAKKDGELSRWT